MHCVPEKYLPMTWKADGPSCGTLLLTFSHTSSRPKSKRVGAPVAGSASVGSGLIHSLYQD